MKYIVTFNDDLQIDVINVQTEHCIAGNSQYAFYTELEMIPQTESAKSIKIYAYDYDSQTREILYEWNDDNGFWLNELKATDTCLYWVLLDDGETFIQQYQLENRELRTIFSYKEGLSIVLTAGKDGIFWYDYYEKEEKISLKWYLEKDNEIHCLEELMESIEEFELRRSFYEEPVSIYCNGKMYGKEKKDGKTVYYLKLREEVYFLNEATGEISNCIPEVTAWRW